jgi:uncharacterized protein (DUF427 family)
MGTGNAEKQMPKAIWKDTVIAESDQTEVVDGYHYFPPDKIDKQYFRASETHTRCGWKGMASYYHVVVNGEVNKDAAWYYPETKPEAEKIAGYIGFWHGVRVEP